MTTFPRAVRLPGRPYSSRSDTAAITPHHRRPPIAAGQQRGRVLEPHRPTWTSCGRLQARASIGQLRVPAAHRGPALRVLSGFGGGSADPAGAGGRRRPDADSTNAASTIVTMTITKSRRHIGSAPKPGVSTLFSRTRMAPPRSAGAPPDRPGSRPIHHSVERTGREPPDSVLARPSGRSAAAPPEDHAGLPSGVKQQVSGDEPVPGTHTRVLREALPRGRCACQKRWIHAAWRYSWSSPRAGRGVGPCSVRSSSVGGWSSGRP
jgi:hypothetical protein